MRIIDSVHREFEFGLENLRSPPKDRESGGGARNAAESLKGNTGLLEIVPRQE